MTRRRQGDEEAQAGRRTASGREGAEWRKGDKATAPGQRLEKKEARPQEREGERATERNGARAGGRASCCKNTMAAEGSRPV